MFTISEKKIDFAFHIFWGVLFILMGLNFVHLYFEYKDYKEARDGLIEVCTVMGGTYIDNNTCIKAQNLFK